MWIAHLASTLQVYPPLPSASFSSLARVSTNSKPATAISTGSVVGSTKLNINIFDEKFIENIGIETRRRYELVICAYMGV